MAGKRGSKNMGDTIDNHAYEATLASVMLDVAVQASDRTQTEIRKALGYRSRSQLSHYMTGLQPIPVGSSERIAEEVGLDTGAFVVAVLRQRYPGVMQEMLVDAPFDLATIQTMRRRLNAEGRSAAIEMLELMRRPLDGSSLKAA